MKSKNKQLEWWENKGGFFGKYYLLGDDSVEGYLPGKYESLEERTKREVDGIVRLLALSEKAWILDCPCGYGRHSIELADRGYRVAGYDINQEHLIKAHQNFDSLIRARKGTELRRRFLHVLFEGRDMRNFTNDGLAREALACFGISQSNRYDAVLNMFLSFGFFETEEENRKVISNFYEVLKEGGKLLIHTDTSPEMILCGSHRLYEERTLRNGGKLVIDEKFNQRTKRIHGSWTIVDEQSNKIKLTPYNIRIYTAEEFKEMAETCGFREVNVYGSFSGEKFTSDNREMIVVAQK